MIEKNELEQYNNCNICPRKCSINRNQNKFGYCKANSAINISHVMLHNWEEPCISGKNGSGAIFFSGCSLACIFCQNQKISRSIKGKVVNIDELVDIFFELKNKGAHNINLVTPTHFMPSIREAIIKAKKMNFDLPFISNTSGYENVETLQMLEGLIDVYLTDFKYMDEKLAEKFSNAKNYPEVAKSALKEMVHQQNKIIFDDEGLIKKGVIVRHLCLPAHTKDSKEIIKYIHDNYKNNVMLSIMNQYTPCVSNDCKIDELKRKLTSREYNNIVDYALSIGVGTDMEAFIQEGETCKESFIPDFQ